MKISEQEFKNKPHDGRSAVSGFTPKQIEKFRTIRGFEYMKAYCRSLPYEVDYACMEERDGDLVLGFCFKNIDDANRYIGLMTRLREQAEKQVNPGLMIIEEAKAEESHSLLGFAICGDASCPFNL